MNNNIKGWGIPKDVLHTQLPDGTYKLLTIDLDFGNRCSLNCPHCFKKEPFVKTKQQNLNYEETISIVKEAKELGLQSIKILGAGEPFENKEFLKFLEFCTNLGVTVAVFSKGHVLGSDELAKKYNSHYGIKSAKELVKRVYDLDVSILLGYNSFEKETQLHYVGINENSKLHNYFELRNNALNLLIEEGFNKETNEPTRLGLIASPFKLHNIDEIFEIYKWGRKQNIYVATCPTTNSGKGRKETNKIFESGKDSYLKKVIVFYTDIYIWTISNDYMTLDSFKEDGVSLYPGVHVCNQTAAGLYITKSGLVLRCPGLDNWEHFVCEDIRKYDLKTVWKNSLNYKLAEREGQFNFHCIARDSYLFTEEQFYNKVFVNVLKHFEQHINEES